MSDSESDGPLHAMNRQIKPNQKQDPKRLQPPFSSYNSIPSHSDDGWETIPGHAIPTLDPIAVRSFLSSELSSHNLSSIYSHLWICGRRRSIHPLHWHRMMSRTILITEQPSLHLIWYQSTIYIKPLPRFLLDWSFWNREICPADDEDSEKEILWREANGFVFTYTHLIVHESDFKIAHEIGLLPPEITWSQWSSLRFDMAAALNLNYPSNVTRRYDYGELRLVRLNLVYRFFRFKLLGYHHIHRDYYSFFSQEFAWLLLLFAYITVTFSALQLALAFSDEPRMLGRVGYYFGVAVLFLVGVGFAVQIGLLVLLFGFHLISTISWNQSVGTA